MRHRRPRNAFGEPQSPEAKEQAEREAKIPTGYEHEELTLFEYFVAVGLLVLVLAALAIFVR